MTATADKYFYRVIGISAAAHIVVAMFIFLKAFTASTERMEIRNAIRVDVVGLPQKAVELPDKPAEKPAEAAAK